jgi:hypothetical protein
MGSIPTQTHAGLRSSHPSRPPPGDDPNYWMALTHQADAKNISKKVKRMLLELNLTSEAGARQVCAWRPLGDGHDASGPLGAPGAA